MGTHFARYKTWRPPMKVWSLIVAVLVLGIFAAFMISALK